MAVRFLPQRQRFHMHHPLGHLHFLAPAGQGVQGRPFPLDGAVHAGALADVPGEGGQRRLDLRPGGVLLAPAMTRPVASWVSVAAPKATSATYSFSLSTR